MCKSVVLSEMSCSQTERQTQPPGGGKRSPGEEQSSKLSVAVRQHNAGPSVTNRNQ